MILLLNALNILSVSVSMWLIQMSAKNTVYVVVFGDIPYTGVSKSIPLHFLLKPRYRNSN